MASTYVMFLPRSGSTILNELLAFKYGNSNLDEFLTPHNKVRVPIDGVAAYNPAVADALAQMKHNVVEISKELPRNEYAKTLSPIFFRMQKERLVKKLIKDGHGLSMKDEPSIGGMGIDYNNMMRWCVDNNVEIHFTFRRDFEAMLYSLFVMIYRVGHIQQKLNDPEFRNSRKDLKYLDAAYASRSDVESSIELPPKQIDEEQFWRVYRSFVHEVYQFKALYYTYKNYATTLCYDDIAESSDFSKSGITPEIYTAYNQSKFHMMKTPQYEIGDHLINFKQYKKYYQSMIGFLDDIQ